MAALRPRPPAAPPRPSASWCAPPGFALLLLAGLAVWVCPVRIQGVIVDPATGEGRVATAWDTSRWQAVAAVWWQVLLLVLALTAVLSVVWYGRSWLIARASAARFFAASVLVHCLLLLALWGVPLARGVVEKAEIIRVSQAIQLFDEGRQPPRPGGRPAYEKVADPPADDAARPDVVRQAAPGAEVPDDTEPLVPTLPAHAVRSLPPERVLVVPPRQPDDTDRPPAMDRRGAAALEPVDIGLDTPPPPPPEAAPTERPVEERRVTQARRQPTAPTPDGPQPLHLPAPERRPTDLHAAGDELPRFQAAEPLPDSLRGRRQPGRVEPAMPREPQAAPKTEASPKDAPPAGVRVTLPRLTPVPASPAPLPDEPPPPDDLPRRRPRVSIPAVQPTETPTAATPSPRVRLPRTPARPEREARVEEKTTPRPAFVQRRKEARQRSLALYGGNAASEAAVERGLEWLASHQNADGSWSLHNFQANCKHPHCPDAGTFHSDPAATGLGLLPFLGAGNTHKAGKYRQTVTRALDWLAGKQRPDGTWPSPGDPRPMYGHGLASIALCEAYGMTQDPQLRGPAQKALDYIVRAQHGPTGGWRYYPNMPADTSVVGWQVMALKSGEMAGLAVPPEALEGVKRWLRSVEGNRPVGGLFGYQSPNPTPAMTAQGLLCLQYLGTRRDDPRMRAGTDYLLAHLPQRGVESSYYWYHATQVMYHMQGKHWKAWNDRLRDMLVSTQETQGGVKGSWQPTDAREKVGGRLYATSLRLLMLEVYYRHLPLYQQLEK